MRLLGLTKGSYQEVFSHGGRSLDHVLWDLQRFCHAGSTTHIKGNPHGSALLEGRRQVWLRINQFIRMNESDLKALVDREARQVNALTGDQNV